MKRKRDFKTIIIAVIVIIATLFYLAGGKFDLNQKENDYVLLTDYVTSVHDGDTIRTKNFTESIRILYIDAPEISPRVNKTDYYGYEARDFLKNEILNKNVKLKCKGKDKYERNLCEIYPMDANTNDTKTSYNYQMVRNGYACPFMNEKKEINEAGIKARNEKIGIFSENSTYKCRDTF